MKKKVRNISLPSIKRFRAKQFKSSAGQYRINYKDCETIEVYEHGLIWVDTGRKLNDRISQEKV